MTVTALFAAGRDQWDIFRDALVRAFAEIGLDVALSPDHRPDQTDYIIFAPNGPLRDFAPFTRCKAVLSLWAGVETIVGNQSLTQPLARMVDPGMTQSMVEYVAGHTLRHHLGMDRLILGQDGVWRRHIPPLAQDRKVTVLGLGALGLACAQSLHALGFAVTGWSRSPKSAPGITCHSGMAGLADALSGAEIAVLLLPRTAETECILNSGTLAMMARGACIINPGRGHLIDDDALLAALDSVQIGHATLDVFRTEPLPADHPFWAHPGVTVTPHIASETRADTAARVIAENIRRGEAGLPFLHLVNRSIGY
jgi:glyoxylate/hydroxypyruvate reductase A